MNDEEIPDSKNTISDIPLDHDLFSKPEIQTQLTRLILQSLDELGFKKTVQTLQEESNTVLRPPTVAKFSDAILQGNWAEAEKLLKDLELAASDLGDVKLLIARQKFLEMLEESKALEAMACLQSEITPFTTKKEDLFHLGSLIACRSKEALYAKARWDGRNGKSRHSLLHSISHLIKSNEFVPSGRLKTLILQAIELQKLNCLYHNTADSHSSLFEDHFCGKTKIPTKELQVLIGHTDEVWHISFSHTGDYLASASKDKSVIIWDLNSFQSVMTLFDHDAEVSYVAWSPDDTKILACAGTVCKLWNSISGECLKTLNRHAAAVSCVSFHPDGRSFFTGSLDKQVIQYNLDGDVLKTWKVARVNDISISADGLKLIVVDQEKKIRIINLFSNEQSVIEEKESISSCHLSKDGSLLLINLRNSEIHLWSLTKKALVQKFQGHKQQRFVIRSSIGGANEGFVASGSEDSRVCIWRKFQAAHPLYLTDQQDESGSAPLRTLLGHTSSVNAVVWSPKAAGILASCSDDHTIRIWG